MMDVYKLLFVFSFIFVTQAQQTLRSDVVNELQNAKNNLTRKWNHYGDLFKWTIKDEKDKEINIALDKAFTEYYSKRDQGINELNKKIDAFKAGIGSLNNEEVDAEKAIQNKLSDKTDSELNEAILKWLDTTKALMVGDKRKEFWLKVIRHDHTWNQPQNSELIQLMNQ